jgi:hypothetical protein
MLLGHGGMRRDRERKERGRGRGREIERVDYCAWDGKSSLEEKSLFISHIQQRLSKGECLVISGEIPSNVR